MRQYVDESQIDGCTVLEFFSRTVVLLSGRLIGAHEYIIRKQEKMWKPDINLKRRQLQDVLLRVFGTKFSIFNSGKHRIVVWERAIWDNVKGLTKLKSILGDNDDEHTNGSWEMFDVDCRELLASSVLHHCLPKLKERKLYFDLILNRNITLDDNENHTFYKSVGSKYLVDNLVVGSDVDIKSFKDFNDQKHKLFNKRRNLKPVGFEKIQAHSRARLLSARNDPNSDIALQRAKLRSSSNSVTSVTSGFSIKSMKSLDIDGMDRMISMDSSDAPDTNEISPTNMSIPVIIPPENGNEENKDKEVEKACNGERRQSRDIRT